MNPGWGYGQQQAGGFGGGFGGDFKSYSGCAQQGFGGGYGEPWPGSDGMKGGSSKGAPSEKGGGKGSSICKFFQQGNCTRGSSCTFSHGESGGGGGKGGGGKGICKFFQQGSCTRGASCAFSHGDSGDQEDDDPDMAEIEAAIAKAQGTKKGDDADMMAELERLDEEHHQNMDVRDNDSNTDASDKLPPPASEAEIAEAQEIVKKAQEDLIERNKMKAKVGGASKDDLQAMINARLAKK